MAKVELTTEDRPDFEKRGGLLPVVVQDFESREVLMVAWINEQAWQTSLDTGFATFWSTSRQELWVKGATSGDYLKICEIRIDCDQDSLVFLVTLQGEGVCHTRNASGAHRHSCFFRTLNGSTWTNLDP